MKVQKPIRWLTIQYKQTYENTERATKNGQSRETDNKTKKTPTTQYLLDTTKRKQTQIT